MGPLLQGTVVPLRKAVDASGGAVAQARRPLLDRAVEIGPVVPGSAGTVALGQVARGGPGVDGEARGRPVGPHLRRHRSAQVARRLPGRAVVVALPERAVRGPAEAVKLAARAQALRRLGKARVYLLPGPDLAVREPARQHVAARVDPEA